MKKISGVKSVADETRKLYPDCHCYVQVVVDKTNGRVACMYQPVNAFVVWQPGFVYVADYKKPVTMAKVKADAEKTLKNDTRYYKVAGLAAYIKPWYTSAFPSDDVGHDIPDKLTFADALTALETGDFYHIIQPADDSVVRERVFAEMACRMDVSYAWIYDKWIKGGNENVG